MPKNSLQKKTHHQKIGLPIYLFSAISFGTILAIFFMIFSNQNKDIDTRIKVYTEWSHIVGVLNSGILISSLFATVFGLRQAYNNHLDVLEENKKRSAFEYLNNITLGRFIDLRDELEQLDINPYDTSTHYLSDRGKFINKSTGKIEVRKLRDILNTFDLICTGIKHGVIDEDIAFDQLHVILLRFWKWSAPYIILARMIIVNSTDESKYNKDNPVYIELENQVYLWLKRTGEISSCKEKWLKAWPEEMITANLNGSVTQEQDKSIKDWSKIYYETEYGFAKHIHNE